MYICVCKLIAVVFQLFYFGFTWFLNMRRESVGKLQLQGAYRRSFTATPSKKKGNVSGAEDESSTKKPFRSTVNKLG